jgi:predicted phosphoadenosine phosphosulfate sulfurtransferase
MKIYQSYDVYEAAKERINYLFDEFDVVGATCSGGKDSTVTLNLVIEVARKRGRLPIPILFIDQESEWQGTIDYVRDIMNRPEVVPIWLQIPFKLANSTSFEKNWLQCWEVGKEEEWMRKKEPDSLKENIYGTDRFTLLFDAVVTQHFPGQSVAMCGGVRAEESPGRRHSLTQGSKYRHITYGKKHDKKSKKYAIYPIYDWSYRDVWKYIHDNKLPYCRIYDLMYQHGVTVPSMRISSLCHETAVNALHFLQEVEPVTWERLTKRLQGINTFKHLNKDSNKVPKTLPTAFSCWLEYRDYLTTFLVTNEDQRKKYFKKWNQMDVKYADMHYIEVMHRAQIASILVNDYHMTKIGNWENSPMINDYSRFMLRGKRVGFKNKHIDGL